MINSSRVGEQAAGWVVAIVEGVGVTPLVNALLNPEGIYLLFQRDRRSQEGL
jgi:hypothetical protein